MEFLDENTKFWDFFSGANMKEWQIFPNLFEDVFIAPLVECSGASRNLIDKDQYSFDKLRLCFFFPNIGELFCIETRG